MSTKNTSKPNGKSQAKTRRALLRVLKVFYILLLTVAVAVLALYLVFKLVIKPPEVDSDVEVTLPASASAAPSAGSPSQGRQEEPEPTAEVVTLTRKEDFYTFLLMGTDDGNGNADTIMVGSYDVKNNKINVLSVPRDTLVDVSRSVKKINAAYGAGGVEELLDELEPILGFRPDHYIMVDIQAFVDVVDILGGVSFYVPCDMQYNDGAGFIIDLKEGTQWLNGEQALQLVRYRGYANADIGRIQTQQKFLKEIGKQVLSWSTVTKLNEYAQVLAKYLKTDLSATELAWFATQALTLDFSSDISFATLPGEGNTKYGNVSSYYSLDAGPCRELINSTVNPYTTDLPAELVRIFQVP